MSGPTLNHDEIRAWADRHKALPAQMKPFTFDSEPAILHFLYGDAARDLEQLQAISWEAFFRQFGMLGLSMCYDESPTFTLVPAGRRLVPRRQARQPARRVGERLPR